MERKKMSTKSSILYLEDRINGKWLELHIYNDFLYPDQVRFSVLYDGEEVFGFLDKESEALITNDLRARWRE